MLLLLWFLATCSAISLQCAYDACLDQDTLHTFKLTLPLVLPDLPMHAGATIDNVWYAAGKRCDHQEVKMPSNEDVQEIKAMLLEVRCMHATWQATYDTIMRLLGCAHHSRLAERCPE